MNLEHTLNSWYWLRAGRPRKWAKMMKRPTKKIAFTILKRLVKTMIVLCNYGGRKRLSGHGRCLESRLSTQLNKYLSKYQRKAIDFNDCPQYTLQCIGFVRRLVCPISICHLSEPKIRMSIFQWAEHSHSGHLLFLSMFFIGGYFRIALFPQNLTRWVKVC